MMIDDQQLDQLVLYSIRNQNNDVIAFDIPNPEG